MRTTVLPDFLSTPVSSTPLPRHSMLRPTSANASSTNSRTDRLARRQHEIVGRIGLQYPVHALDIIPGVAPVASRPEVSEIERLLETGLDAGDAAGDLAGHEGLATNRAFMIEQDAIGGEHAVRLAVVHRDPIAIKLGDAIGRARIERRRLLLRNLL